MMQWLDRRREVSGAGLYFARNWSWIAAGAAATLIYETNPIFELAFDQTFVEHTPGGRITVSSREVATR